MATRHWQANVLALPQINLGVFGAQALSYWDYPNSVYPCWRLYWNDCGGACVSADAAYPLDAQHIVLVPPYTPVNLSLNGRISRHLYLCFTLHSPAVQAQRRVFRMRPEVALRRLADDVAGRIASGRKDAALGMLTLALIAQSLAMLPATTWSEQSIDARIGEAMQYIEGALARRISARDLAARSHLTANSFARLFRGELGSSPREYILERRLFHAAHRLMATECSIKQIASDCGFCDRYYFTRMFKAMHGISPGAYRMQKKQA